MKKTAVLSSEEFSFYIVLSISGFVTPHGKNLESESI